MILSAYERLFVAFYGWSLRVDGRGSSWYNVYSASLMLSLGSLLNIAAFLIFLEMLSGVPILTRFAQFSNSRIWVVLAVIAYASMHFLYFGSGGRYRALVSKYAGDEQTLLATPKKGLIAYMALSVSLVITLLFAMLNYGRST